MTDEKARAEQRFEAIRKMLDNIGSRGLHYTADRDQLRIKLQMPAGLVRTTCTFIVEDGDIIIMMIGTNIHVEDESAQMRVLRRINEINSRLIQGTFYLDPRDNEIMVSTGMHLGETMPDEDMLHDMLFAPLSSVRRQIEGLVAEILRSEPKQEKRGNDQLNALIAQMMDDADDDDDDDLIESIAEELAAEDGASEAADDAAGGEDTGGGDTDTGDDTEGSGDTEGADGGIA